MPKLKACKNCLGTGHTAFNCPRRARKQLQTRSVLKPKKRIKRIGKVGKALLGQTKRYREEHPGAQQCFYCEFIGHIELIDNYQVEHPYSKTHHPGLRFAYELLVPGCPGHNEDKRSKDVDVYLAELAERYGLPQERVDEYLEKIKGGQNGQVETGEESSSPLAA